MAVLADEAVAIVTRLVVPGVAILSPQVDARLVSADIIRLIVHSTGEACIPVPVCIVHNLVSEIGKPLSGLGYHFPYKLGLGSGVFPLSGRPYVDSVIPTCRASRPCLICTQSTTKT